MAKIIFRTENPCRSTAQDGSWFYVLRRSDPRRRAWELDVYQLVDGGQGEPVARSSYPIEYKRTGIEVARAFSNLPDEDYPNLCGDYRVGRLRMRDALDAVYR